jgi:hypothetical protein
MTATNFGIGKAECRLKQLKWSVKDELFLTATQGNVLQTGLTRSDDHGFEPFFDQT